MLIWWECRRLPSMSSVNFSAGGKLPKCKRQRPEILPSWGAACCAPTWKLCRGSWSELQLLFGNFWMALRYPGANRGVDLIQLSREEMLRAGDHYQPVLSGQ